jgi:glycosyltransferase involved in cell wall biosynthesis
LKVVIISRKRSESITKNTFALVPSSMVSVAEEEAEAYEKAGIPKAQLLVHPNDVLGTSTKRNWVLKNVADEVCVIMDDDFSHMVCLVGRHYRIIKDEAEILAMLRNAEHGARVIGTPLFCFNNVNDIRKYHPLDPFCFIGYPQGIHGIIGRTVWYDEHQRVHNDVDYALQVIKKYRVIFMDKRFGVVQRSTTTKMVGGNQGLMSRNRSVDERKYLKSKWGKYYIMSSWQNEGVKSTVSVQRRQSNLITPDKM